MQQSSRLVLSRTFSNFSGIPKSSQPPVKTICSQYRLISQIPKGNFNLKVTTVNSHHQQHSIKRNLQLNSNTKICKSKAMPAQSGSISSLRPAFCEENIDPSQLQLLAEECILVNENDEVIGHDSKKKCHLIDPVTGDIPLHRAFSVFLFNTKGQLLLQQRSKTKVTFPSMYSNTCCSHPLYTNADEIPEQNGLGCKIAAQRRLFEELGIPKNQLPLESFKYLTRVHYKAASGDTCWGEHEIDYILFIQADVQINLNPNEVDDVRYLSLNEFKEFESTNNVQFTPWFSLILKSGKLQEWWNNINNLEKFQESDKIQRMF